MELHPKRPGVSNTEILEEDDPTQREPTLSEVVYPMSTTRWLWSSRMRFMAPPNGDLLNSVRLHRHLDYGLADSSPQAHDFYLVTRPGTVHLPTGSVNHWSVYCQGHFYHLSAPGLPRETLAKSKNASRSETVACRLRHQDLSDPTSEDYRNVRDAVRKKALLAYKVGQTDYHSGQVLRLAEYIISTLPAYGLMTANCQHFAKEMVRRCLTRLGDRASFIGTATQIVDWDSAQGDHQHIDSAEHGFVFAEPRPERSSYKEDVLWHLKHIALDKTGVNFEEPVRILLEKGPLASGSFLGPGHIRQKVKLDIYGVKRALVFAGVGCVEFKEDLLRGRWKDAIIGRRKEQPDGTIRRPFAKKPQQVEIEPAGPQRDAAD